MTYVSAMEPLLMCNELMGETVFETFTVALSGAKTVSSLGNAIDTHYSLENAPKADTWIGWNIPGAASSNAWTGGFSD